MPSLLRPASVSPTVVGVGVVRRFSHKPAAPWEPSACDPVGRRNRHDVSEAADEVCRPMTERAGRRLDRGRHDGGRLVLVGGRHRGSDPRSNQPVHVLAHRAGEQPPSADATDGHQRPPLRLEGSGRLYVQRQLVDAHHQPRIAVLDRRVSSHRDAAVAVQHDPQRDLGFQSGQRRT
jgi:hypothetical protein